MKDPAVIETSYRHAKAEYEALGVDTDTAIKNMDKVVIGLHCWQADDVAGFEKPDAVLGGGGILATGNCPGKARTIDQLRTDIEKVMSLFRENNG